MQGLASLTAPIVFDRRLYAARRARAERAGAASFLVDRAAETIAERLSGMNRRFNRALDLGSRISAFPHIAPYAEEWVRTSLWASANMLSADEEALPFAERCFDLVVSVLALHAVNDLPGALLQIRHALAPGGAFLAALFGGETLCELRQALAAGEVEKTGGASPRVAPFADVRDMGALLQRAGFAGPVADLDRVEVRYHSLATLVSDLRAMGETNSLAGRRRNVLARGTVGATLAHYAANYADASGMNATFDVIYLTGWGSRECQTVTSPRPLP